MEEKISDTINNICTILGGALLLYPVIDQATKTLIPEMQKLSSGEITKELKQLTDGAQYDKSEEKKGYDLNDNQIAELKRLLREYEEKEKENQGF